MNDIETNLARYLELEGLLNVFFSALNFCYEQCVLPERMQNGELPVAACFALVWVIEKAMFLPA